jgi:outer membrane protein OmpA-like peptidoglycan-associated protein
LSFSGGNDETFYTFDIRSLPPLVVGLERCRSGLFAEQRSPGIFKPPRTMKKSLLVLLLTASLALHAQKKPEIGAGMGLTYILSELDPFPEGLGLFRPVGSGFFRSHLHPQLSLRGDLTLGWIAADEGLYRSLPGAPRGLSFAGPFVEGLARVEWYPLGHYRKPRKDSTGTLPRKINIFLAGGVGAVYYNPKVDYNLDNEGNPFINPDDLAANEANQTNFAAAIPIGGGITYRINERYTLGAEGFLRVTNSDYLDGVREASGSTASDWYLTGQLTLSRRLGQTDNDGDGVFNDVDRCPDLPGVAAAGGCPDADADGTPDKLDNCPQTSGPAHLLGCPDTDRDSIADGADRCPDIAGSRSLQGCPDTDRDGVPDPDDLCPTIPGNQQSKGCPGKDRDLDGVDDLNDLCPDNPGLQVFKGCPDTDNDGVADNNDACPEKAGERTLQGCPDSDSDGVADRLDNCPNQKGPPANNGCPPGENRTKAGIAFKAVYFGSTRESWFSSSEITLEEILRILTDNPHFVVRLEGHADNDMEQGNALALAQSRAIKCRDYLQSKGIGAERMQVESFGSSRPAPTMEPGSLQQRALSRRVEIHFFKKE